MISQKINLQNTTCIFLFCHHLGIKAVRNQVYKLFRNCFQPLKYKGFQMVRKIILHFFSKKGLTLHRFGVIIQSQQAKQQLAEYPKVKELVRIERKKKMKQIIKSLLIAILGFIEKEKDPEEIKKYILDILKVL